VGSSYASSRMTLTDPVLTSHRMKGGTSNSYEAQSFEITDLHHITILAIYLKYVESRVRYL
jgi:hypothetical protein